MHINLRHFFVQYRGAISILMAVLLAGSLALLVLPHVSSQAFASSLGQTCAQAPTMEHCDKQDPEVQGCAADADTIAKQDIVSPNGQTIGRVERRFSQKCMSWWGRVFAFGPALHRNMFIAIAGVTLSKPATFPSDTYDILYGPMVFETSPTQTVPEITGTVTLSATSALSATIPAIIIPQ